MRCSLTGKNKAEALSCLQGENVRIFAEYAAFGLVQSCCLVFLIVLSVWKPKKTANLFKKISEKNNEILYLKRLGEL